MDRPADNVSRGAQKDTSFSDFDFCVQLGQRLFMLFIRTEKRHTAIQHANKFSNKRTLFLTTLVWYLTNDASFLSRGRPFLSLLSMRNGSFRLLYGLNRRAIIASEGLNCLEKKLNVWYWEKNERRGVLHR